MSEISRELDSSNIDTAIRDYLILMNQIPRSIKSDNTYNFLKLIKRNKINCGPYPNVTLFESANRIMTDLIILFGIKELLNGEIKDLKYNKYKVEFGNDNFNQNDILAINNESMLIGEAFNVAPSFFHIKKYSALKKMRRQINKNKKMLLIYNSDAVTKNYKPKLKPNEYHLAVEIKFP